MPRADKSEDPDADPESVARRIALNMLERQPRTRAELARGMARRGVPFVVLVMLGLRGWKEWARTSVVCVVAS